MADPFVPEGPFVCAAEAALPPGWERTDPVPGTANLTVAYDPRWHTMARLLDQYNTTIAPAIASKFNLTNKMAIPKLDKIVINMGVGRATQDKALLEAAVDGLSKISGQKPLVTKARSSVAGFRLREGNEIGCKVTLRGRRMYEFFDRLISIALPRIRDFRGVNPNSFDGHGNFTLGLAEQVVFPEIDADRVHHTQGMDITIVTTTSSDDQARELLRSFGMPFRLPQQPR